jgi:hypothetical protein
MGTMSETPLEQTKRHVASLERIIAAQSAAVALMEQMGDTSGAKTGRELLESFRRSYASARDRLKRLSGSDTQGRTPSLDVKREVSPLGRSEIRSPSGETHYSAR